MNILILKPSSLGDIVHAFPAVRLLRKQFPDATIAWLVNAPYADLVGLCPDIDQVICFHRHRLGKPRYWPELFRFIRDLRRRRFDVAVDLQGLLRTGLFAFLSGARRRIGFRAAREGAHFFYNERVLLPANLSHAVDKNLFLVQAGLDVPEDACIWELAELPVAGQKADDLLKPLREEPGTRVVAVAPAARWPSKRWPPDFFAQVIDRAATQHPACAFWLLGTEDEAAVGQQVADACQVARPQNLMGKADLGTLVELLRRTDVLLTNDSGPMHVAAALRVPTVALFGPTDPDLTGPYGDQNHVFRGACDRAPCFERRCPSPSRRCVDSVKADVVADALVEQLASYTADIR